MDRVYLDNSATSFPKPQAVRQAVMASFEMGAGNPGRTASETAFELERKIYDARVSIAALFHFQAFDHVIFTKNITEAINLVLFSVLKPGDAVVTSAIEHNAVIRPLEALRRMRGIEIMRIPFEAADPSRLDLEALEAAFAKKPKLFALTCASNVSGNVTVLEDAARLSEAYGIPLLLDTAQAAGVIDLDFSMLNVAYLAFTGHKSLLGPQGTGGLLIRPDLAHQLEPLIYGGTGSYSELLTQPDVMPDRFESGTGNSMGIVGLGAAVSYIQAFGLDKIAAHERGLIEQLEVGLKDDTRLYLLNQVPASQRVGVLSVDFKSADNAIVAHDLSRKFGITTRVGLHCAPEAHQAYGTYPNGTVRFSVSPFTTEAEVAYTIDAVKKVLDEVY